MPDPTKLGEVEEVVREFANSIFRRQNIDPKQVIVFLSKNMGNAVMHVEIGNPVKLTINWNEGASEIKSIIYDFCKAFRRHRLVRTMEIVPFSLIYENKKWAKATLKKGFKNVEETVILDLLSRNRLEIVREEIVVLRDKVTKMSVTERIISKPERFEGEQMQMWFDLSRAVANAFPEEDQENENEIKLVKENG